jgi:hypothetical protein
MRYTSVPFPVATALFLIFSSAHSEGWVGQGQVNEPDSLFDAHSAITIDPDGDTWIAFRGRPEDDRMHIYSRTWEAAGWRPELVVTPDTNWQDGFPAIACDPTGHPLVAWMRETGGFERYDIYFAMWNGSEWVEGGTVHPPHPWEDGGPFMASGGGELWIIWGRMDPGDDRTREMYACFWEGSDWSSELFICGPDSSSRLSGWKGLAVDYEGTPHVVWSTYPGDQEIFYSTFDGNSWTEKLQINLPDSLEQDLDPAIAADSMGNLHVVWAARTYGSPYGYEILYSKSDGASWSPEVQINEPDTRGDYRPDIEADSPDNVWVVWDGVDPSGEYHIHAVHYNGSTWSSEYRLDNDETDHDEQAFVALNADGHPWVTWTGYLVDNPQLDIFYNCYQGPQSQFVRADANGDMAVRLSDVISILMHLFVPGSPVQSCMATADANDDGSIEMADAMYILRYLYVPGSPEPSPPFPECGTDPTPDVLGCEWHPCEE